MDTKPTQFSSVRHITHKLNRIFDQTTFIRIHPTISGQRAPALARECYWVLHGQLSNPFTGDVIAAVRGVEVVRLAGSSALPCQALPGTKKALQLAPHHTTTTAGSSSSSSGGANPSHNQWRAVASVLSAKSFRYFHPLTGQPLLTFRPSPRAKPRAVPAAVRSLQAVTYALSRRGHLHLVSESVSGGLLAVRDEGKGAGAAAVAPAATAASGKRRLVVPWSWPPPFLRRAPRRFELSLLMWPGSKQRPERRRGRASEEEGEGEAEASGGGGGWGGLTSIPWSSLVQLGASSSQPPCRELYAFSTEPARGWGRGGRRPRMRYLRYGECPHWCGAGRVCHLTLEGVRYDRYQDIPRADRALFFGEPKERKGWGRRRKGEEGEQEQQQAEAVGGGAVVTMAPPPLPLTTQDFADEMELEKRRRRKRFFFF